MYNMYRYNDCYAYWEFWDCVHSAKDAFAFTVEWALMGSKTKYERV